MRTDEFVRDKIQEIEDCPCVNKNFFILFLSPKLTMKIELVLMYSKNFSLTIDLKSRKKIKEVSVE